MAKSAGSGGGKGSSGGKKAPGGGKGSGRALVLVESAASALLLVVLLFVVHWLAAVSIASALWVFLDTAALRVNRVTPSAKKSQRAGLFWSVAGFVPVAGLGLYVILRRRLSPRPDVKVATGGEAVKTLKERLRAVPLPSAVAVGVIALGLALFTLRTPGRFRIEFGTSVTAGLRIQGTSVRGRYDVGRIRAKMSTREPVEGYANFDWKLYLDGADGGPLETGTATARAGSGNTIWVWTVRARVPGDYRLDVVDAADRVIARGYFTAVERR